MYHSSREVRIITDIASRESEDSTRESHSSRSYHHNHIIESWRTIDDRRSILGFCHYDCHILLRMAHSRVWERAIDRTGWHASVIDVWYCEDMLTIYTYSLPYRREISIHDVYREKLPRQTTPHRTRGKKEKQDGTKYFHNYTHYREDAERSTVEK